MKLSSMQVDRKYPITDAKGLQLDLDLPLISLFAIQQIEFFMSRTFYSSFSNVDIEDINSEKVALNLIFKCQIVNTLTFKVAIEQQ